MWWAGPSATSLLAAFGADVIHVEGPGRMDGMRVVGMSFPGRADWWEWSPFFLTINVNKRDLVLDLTSDRGRQIALELIKHVDLVVENFTPRVLDKLGLGWDSVHAANPRAIQVRMPAFGLDGPWRERPGFAQNIEQATSLAWVTGHADDQPRIQRGPCDPNGGLHAVIGMMAALDERDRTGKGSLVEASLFDAALRWPPRPSLNGPRTGTSSSATAIAARWRRLRASTGAGASMPGSRCRSQPTSSGGRSPTCSGGSISRPTRSWRRSPGAAPR